MAVPPVFVAGQVLTAAQMNAIGLWKIAAASVSAVTTITFDNVFTADYDNYFFTLRYTTSGGNAISYVNRVGGANATSNYNYQEFSANGAASIVARTTASASFVAGGPTNGAFDGYTELTIVDPAKAAHTSLMMNNSYSESNFTTPRVRIIRGNHSTASAYDGFEIAIAGGQTITGNYVLYGYRD